jgi:mRNA interferase ChpB
VIRRRVPQRGDVYWVDPNPVSGHEMKDLHRFVVITRIEINALGVAMTVPIISGGAFARESGLTVPILGRDTHGVAVCNQVRTFDLDAREKAGSARYVETLDPSTMAEIVNRVISVVDPAQS